MRLAGRYAAILLAAAALLMGGCSSLWGPGEGKAFLEQGRSWIGIPPVPPGEQWVLMIAFLRNVTPTTVRLDSVRIGGPGVGGVVRAVKIEIAPLGRSEAYDWVPGGTYKTYPPAALLPDRVRCSVQTLVPVNGYELAPGAEARVAVLLEAVGSGRFRITEHVISYEQDGVEYVQSQPVGIVGRVVDGADPMRLAGQRPCADLTGILP